MEYRYTVNKQEVVLNEEQRNEILFARPTISLYTDKMLTTCKYLTIEQKGKLLQMILDFRTCGTVSDQQRSDEPILQLAFDSIVDGFKHDDEAYITKVLTNKENGKNGGRPKEQENPKKPKETQENPKKPKETQENPRKPKKTQENPMGYVGLFGKPNITLTDTDTETDTKTDTGTNTKTNTGTNTGTNTDEWLKNTYNRTPWSSDGLNDSREDKAKDLCKQNGIPDRYTDKILVYLKEHDFKPKDSYGKDIDFTIWIMKDMWVNNI